MERLAMTFGRRVRALREAKRWTQEDLAKAAGLGAKHIGVIERGEKTSSFDAIERIAAALKVEYCTLFVSAKTKDSDIEEDIRAAAQLQSKDRRAAIHRLFTNATRVLKKLDSE